MIIIGILGSMMLAYGKDTPLFGGGLKAQEVSEENIAKAKQMAENFLKENKDKDNWKDQNPRLGKSMILHNRSPLWIEYRVHCDHEENCWFIVITVDDMDYGLGRIFVSEVETKNSLDWDEYWKTKNPIPPSVEVENMMLEDGLPKWTLKAAQKEAQKWIDSNKDDDGWKGNNPTLGKRTIIPRLKNDFQIIEYRVECTGKKECGFINIMINRNGAAQMSSASSTDRAPSTWLETKPEDAPKGGTGKLKFQKTGGKIPASYSSMWSAVGPQKDNDFYRENFKKDAFCKISPNSQIILSTMEEQQWEKIPEKKDDFPYMLGVCGTNLYLNILVKNDHGKYLLKTIQQTQLPMCQEFRAQGVDGGWGPRTISQDFLIPGRFITAPIIVNQNSFIVPSWNTVDHETLPQIDTSQLPECQPNIKSQK